MSIQIDNLKQIISQQTHRTHEDAYLRATLQEKDDQVRLLELQLAEKVKELKSTEEALCKSEERFQLETVESCETNSNPPFLFSDGDIQLLESLTIELKKAERIYTFINMPDLLL